MSEAVSALGGRVASGPVTVRDAGPRGMITLRGDLSDTTLRTLASGLTGLDFPGIGRANCVGENGLLWMSPDELLILRPHGEVGTTLKAIGDRLAGTHHLATDVSDARALFLVEGAGGREVLQKLTPASLHPDDFAPGQFRRTRLAQAAAGFWMRDAETFEVICFRSVAGYVFDLIAAAAAAGPVGVFKD